MIECFILKKNGEYFQTKFSMVTGGYTQAKYSNSPYDAKKYERERDAYREAVKQGAEIVKFNTINGRLEETTPIEKRKCGTCHWWAKYNGACCNGRSEHRADFRLSDEGCEEWAGSKKDGGTDDGGKKQDKHI